jgi:drug/metabolite transporter (DMT)-like permease
VSRTAWAAALGAIVLWALFATLVRHAGATPPLLLTGITLCFGSLVSLPRWRAWRVPAATWVFGTGCLFVYHVCLVAAFHYAPIAEANLVNYLWPMLIVLLAARRTPGGLRRPQLWGCALAFIGCAVAIAPTGWSMAPGHLGGYALAAVAALTWAVYSLGPRGMPAYASWATGGFCLGAGVLALLAHTLFEAPYAPSLAQWGWMAAIGAGPLGLAFVLWNLALRRGSASTIGTLSYATPMLSTLALALAGAISEQNWLRIGAALCMVVAGVRLTR